MRNIHSHAVNVEKSCPLARKCQRSTQKTSVGDSVSSNLYNVGAGGTSRSFFFLLFFLICNFSLRLDRISASALYYLDIHKPYTLHRTVTSRNAEPSRAQREEILCSKWNHQDSKRRVYRSRQRGRNFNFLFCSYKYITLPKEVRFLPTFVRLSVSKVCKSLWHYFFPSFLLWGERVG